MTRTKRQTVSIHLRLPADLYRQISQVANGNSPQVSINFEITRRLLDSFKMEEQSTEIERLVQRVAQLEADKK